MKPGMAVHTCIRSWVLGQEDHVSKATLGYTETSLGNIAKQCLKNRKKREKKKVCEIKNIFH
jgi:hypothetical protein